MRPLAAHKDSLFPKTCPRTCARCISCSLRVMCSLVPASSEGTFELNFHPGFQAELASPVSDAIMEYIVMAVFYYERVIRPRQAVINRRDCRADKRHRDRPLPPDGPVPAVRPVGTPTGTSSAIGAPERIRSLGLEMIVPGIQAG